MRTTNGCGKGIPSMKVLRAVLNAAVFPSRCDHLHTEVLATNGLQDVLHALAANLLDVDFKELFVL